ncbi:MAG: Holliday junction branch migration protein RuvA [SAR202 cluster bacterium Io17-Chloro-G9]|nr:MAG: Holliday junction branch migration protein RuvA [SAR202 cluster bacterium Io17-Chloro-G9]
MIVNLKGNLEAVGTDWVHLQLGGVTFQVFVPASAIVDLGPVGGPVRLFTHMRIRDEQPVLYGFPTAASMELFQLLTAVSGVGPRLALALLSTLGPSGLHQAIATADVAALNSAPGVGQRTASRIVLDLKGKLDFDDEALITATGGFEADVIAALTALGYSTAEARRGVAGLSRSESENLEDLIRQALQSLSAGSG